MTTCTTLKDYILLYLRTAEIIPLPEKEEWKDTMERVCVPGQIAEVNEDTYDWFLDCLPPKWQGAGFAFAEGAEALKYFWHKDGRYFSRQLTWDETKDFCRLARIGLPW